MHRVLTYFELPWKKPTRVELEQWGSREYRTSVQIEWLRRPSEEVTSVPRAKR